MFHHAGELFTYWCPKRMCEMEYAGCLSWFSSCLALLFLFLIGGLFKVAGNPFRQQAVMQNNIVPLCHYRSLGLLADAIACSDRAYLFDNTYAKASLKLEVTQGHDVVLHHSLLPEWIASNLKKSTN
jgi:hypothetical protein